MYVTRDVWAHYYLKLSLKSALTTVAEFSYWTNQVLLDLCRAGKTCSATLSTQT